MTEICQTQFPEALAHPRALPGIAPLDAHGWITIDEAYRGQMARRRALLDTQKDAVLAHLAGSEAAQAEALEEAVRLLERKAGFLRAGTVMTCPDGRNVDLTGPPLEVLTQLIQEDVCLLERPLGASEHVLTAASLCFPASWMLSEKMGRPLIGIHEPVAEYDDMLAKRVQRLFDGIKPGRPLWRFNRLWYADAELFQPRSEHARRAPVSKRTYDYLRMEKQSLVRLPKSQAVLFAIHTYVIHKSNVPREVEARFID